MSAPYSDRDGSEAPHVHEWDRRRTYGADPATGFVCHFEICACGAVKQNIPLDREAPNAPKSLEGNEPETTQGASGSPSNPTTSSDVLRRVTKYRAAIMAASLRAEISGQDESELAAKAVIEVANKEQARLQAEVERLRRERDGIGCSRFTCADDLGRMRRRAEKAEAELNAMGMNLAVEAAKHRAAKAKVAELMARNLKLRVDLSLCTCTTEQRGDELSRQLRNDGTLAEQSPHVIRVSPEQFKRLEES